MWGWLSNAVFFTTWQVTEIPEVRMQLPEWRVKQFKCGTGFPNSTADAENMSQIRNGRDRWLTQKVQVSRWVPALMVASLSTCGCWSKFRWFCMYDSWRQVRNIGCMYGVVQHWINLRVVFFLPFFLFDLGVMQINKCWELFCMKLSARETADITFQMHHCWNTYIAESANWSVLMMQCRSFFCFVFVFHSNSVVHSEVDEKYS